MPDLFGSPDAGRVYRSAGLSPCGLYRWWLSRSWRDDAGKGCVCFVMLNPSKADAAIDDPTIRRCVGFARRWGYGALSVRNLFALRATDPAELRKAADPTGGGRGDLELRVALAADLLVVAWGAGVPFGRDREALAMFAGKPLWCLGVTKAGHPRHPLYVRADQPLIPFPPRSESEVPPWP